MAIHNQLKKDIADWVVTQTYRMILLRETYVPNVDSHNFYSDIIAHEISAPGYTAKGKLLTGVISARSDANDTAKFTADSPVSWANLDASGFATGTGIAYLAIIRDTGVNTTSTVVQTKRLQNGSGAATTFNGNYSNFPVPIPSTEGIFTLGGAAS